MKVNEVNKVITDIEAFKDRTDEIDSKVSYETVKNAISRLKKTLYDNPDTAALCAPQIGINLRLFIVRQARKEIDRFKVFLNPIIANSEGLHLSRETSLSFPGKQFIIPRRSKIHVAYQEEMGEVNSETYIGAYAEVIQQMIEMLDGITLFDYGLDLDDVGGAEEFDKASKKQQTEVLALYLSSLKSISEDLAEEIKNNPELNKINTAIDEMTEELNKEFEQSKKDQEQKKEEKKAE